MTSVSTLISATRAHKNAATLSALLDVFLEHGFVDLSVEDIARLVRRSKSTLYELAPSKDEITAAVVREFFRRATTRVETRIAGESPRERLTSYLRAVADELAPASSQFLLDLERHPEARHIYDANIRMASQRVRELSRESLGDVSSVRPDFVGVVSGLVMNAIHRGEVAQLTNMTLPEAYSALAEFISAGIRRPSSSSTERDRA